ncbi:Protein of unknown function DUF262 [Chitinophaga sp. YR627]|uniref:DUF262 domain-containing protein n=1 Tax=Chitinophaga sp. YR627 TaxID=1881041 RepID=UPI0008E1756F|nr:DUF262 domain-containing protein [Chitinophaga sp. YR627]SFN93067.1 Protein of unknown function DUF262 [Chitinophaga sp. YR627]
MTEKQIKDAELQIIEKQRVVDYDIKEFTLEILVSKYNHGLENDENEIFVPTYQRNFVWSPERQSKFIESILLGLPVPYIFTADIEDGRLEIVDGSQRIRTLDAFLNNHLKLTDLELLDKLNGMAFKDLPAGRQRKIKNSTIRMITLSDKSDDDIRFLLFERINTGSDLLKDMEKRRGIFGGKFLDFVRECAEHPLFVKHTTFTPNIKKRGEPEELILRFFAYSDEYQSFTSGVNDFLNRYTVKRNKTLEKTRLKSEFERMLQFVDKHLPNGFKRKEDSAKTPRTRFEAISVGINLALRQNSNIKSPSFSFLNTVSFEGEVTGGSHNSPNRVRSRIEFVRDKLLRTK